LKYKKSQELHSGQAAFVQGGPTKKTRFFVYVEPCNNAIYITL